MTDNSNDSTYTARDHLCPWHGDHRGGAEHRVPDHILRLRHRRETRHFCWDAQRVLKAMFACPRPRELPGPSTALAPKPPSLRAVFGQDFVQIITHFLSPNTNPNEVRPKPGRRSATRRGRVPSIAARCGHNTCSPLPFPPAPTQVARIPARLPAYCFKSIGSQQGPTGGKVLTQTTFIQRLNTNGGSAPATAVPLPPMSASKRWCRTPPTTTSSARRNSCFKLPVHARRSDLGAFASGGKLPRLTVKARCKPPRQFVICAAKSAWCPRMNSVRFPAPPNTMSIGRSGTSIRPISLPAGL